MASGKYSRVNGRKSSSGSCWTVSIVVFVALCLVGVWMMTSSVVPGQNSDVFIENKNEVNKHVVESNDKTKNESSDRENDERISKQFEDGQGDLPEEATEPDTSLDSNEEGKNQNADGMEKQENKSEGQSEDRSKEKSNENKRDGSDKGGTKDDTNENGELNEVVDDSESGENIVNKSDDNVERSTESLGEKDGEKGNESTTQKEGDAKGSADENGESSRAADDSESGENILNKSDDNEKKSKVSLGEKDQGKGMDTSGEKDKTTENGLLNPNSAEKNSKFMESFPSDVQSELLNESTTHNGGFSTQATESKKENEAQKSSQLEEQNGVSWKLCNTSAGPDYIPCLDNWAAVRSLPSTMHYEHRERHCPNDPPICLVPLPQGYRRPKEWPTSREKIWYHNVPHSKLASIKGHQNWVKVSGDYLIFPGGGTQFKNGALHYIDVIQQSVPEIAWGNRSRVVLDVGCGVASFGGFLFDRDVLTMSLAPKDEHEAQVQFALERGIPAISAVMGTKRLPYPGRVFDVVHCARCRVPWHIEGGKLLLELNRLLRPGGFFVWSATPIYQKIPRDVEIWEAMKKLTQAMCWEVVSITNDQVNGVGIAIYRKPTSNECYEQRSQNDPPLCKNSDDPNAAWNVQLQACMHRVPNASSVQGSQWPEQWPARVDKAPYWLLSSQVGVYGKPAPQDFTADSEHWKRVVSRSYLNGLAINWSTVRNVMDMRAVYGGFAAALRQLNLWVMNVVSIDDPDTLPIIYERGLFGIYHNWCESFSTYPRSYDLLHADHLFSKIKNKCNFMALMAEADRILRPEGKIIVRDKAETITELGKLFKSLQWEILMTYSRDKEGLLCAQKSTWRPKEEETIPFAIA